MLCLSIYFVLNFISLGQLADEIYTKTKALKVTLHFYASSESEI